MSTILEAPPSRPIPSNMPTSSLPSSILSSIASFLSFPSSPAFIDNEGHLQRRPNRHGLRPQVGFDLTGRPPSSSSSSGGPSSSSSSSASTSSQAKKSQANRGGGGEPTGLAAFSSVSKSFREVALPFSFRYIAVGGEKKGTVKMLILQEEVCKWVRSLHIEHPNPSKPGLESTLLYLPRLLSRTPNLTSLSFHLPPCRLPSNSNPNSISASCNLQLLQIPSTALPNLTSLAIHHQTCSACIDHLLNGLSLGNRVQHLLVTGLVDHFDATVETLPEPGTGKGRLETFVWVQIEFGFFGAGGGSAGSQGGNESEGKMTTAGMVKLLAKRCGESLVDVRLFSVQLDSLLVEEPRGDDGGAKDGVFNEEFQSLLSFSPLLPNLSHLDIGLSYVHRLYRWPGYYPLNPTLPTTNTNNASLLLSHRKDHRFHSTLNWSSYLLAQQNWNRKVIDALRDAFPKLKWSVLETVVEEFEGPTGWNEAMEDVWEMRELAPRGRVAWEVVPEEEGGWDGDGEGKRREVGGGVKREKGMGRLVVYPVEGLELR